MDKYETAIKLMRCFPGSFINQNGEFIAHGKSNTYLDLQSCHTLQDLQCKILEWLSRAAFKTAPYRSEMTNQKFHRLMLAGINEFLGTNFTKNDMELIYTHLGNGIQHDLTVEFVESGYDMEIPRNFGRRKIMDKVRPALERMGAQAHGEG